MTGGLRGYYFHPQWPEVVRLVAAQLTPPLAESLLANILDDPDPVGRFLRRGHLLALGCLSDGTTIANRRFVRGILDSLAELGKSRWLGITMQVIDLLQGLTGMRLQDTADRTLNAILETAKRELDDEEHRCLYHWVHGQEVSRFVRRGAAQEFLQRRGGQGKCCRDRRQDICGFSYQRQTAGRESRQVACERLRLLEDPGQTLELKKLLVREMGRRVVTNPKCRVRLRQILSSAGSRRCESFPPRRWALPPGAETARGASCFGSLRMMRMITSRRPCGCAVGRRGAAIPRSPICLSGGSTAMGQALFGAVWQEDWRKQPCRGPPFVKCWRGI